MAANPPVPGPVAGPQIDTAAYDRIQDGVLQMLGMAPVAGSALRLAPFRVPETAVHDFTQYVFLRDPNAFVGTAANPPTQADLDQFLFTAGEIIRYTVETYCATEVDTGTYNARNLVPMFSEFEAILYQLFLANAAGELYELSSRISPTYPGSSGSARSDILAAFAAWLKALVQSAQFDPATLAASFDNPNLWVDAVQQILQFFLAMFPGAQFTGVSTGENDYDFSPFPTGLVNFGLRLVYRQEWRPLGTQSGEIVRTIPLGPKQTERVSTKVVIAQREARTTESFVSTETSTESSNLTRESNDVVEEASSSLKWHVDAEASANVGMYSAKLSAGVAGDSAESSKESKSRLNETMQKTASKMRRDMKVVISTERSITEETSRSSEITNPNDEVAVTYVYSKLQRQYEIQTTLAEVNSVVFVPERVPAWSEITPEWLRKVDWIIARVMLDPSFAADLAELAREPNETAPNDPQSVFENAAINAKDAVKDYKDFKGGGAFPDLFSTVQATFERHLEKKRASDANQARRDQRNQRLIDHVRQNILHYMRAIWQTEDSDQRLRRYARILVPTRWTFVPYGAPDPANPELEVEGEFLPDLGAQSVKSLSDIINPAGPVGYAGNYAVYYVRGDPRLASLNGALSFLRAQYVRFLVTVQGAGVAIRQAVAISPRYRRAEYSLQRNAGGWVAQHQASGQPVTVQAESGDTTVRFDGLLIRFDAAPAQGTPIAVLLLATGELEDPELRMLRETVPMPTLAEEAGYYDEGLLRDMSSYLPEIGALLPVDLSQGWGALDNVTQEAIRQNYHRYVLLKEHTRRFLLETNNLMIDMEVGQTPGLEQFKRLHRAIDVLKELEEGARRAIENERRSRKVVAGDYADPDIEQATVIGSAQELRAVVGPVIAPPAAPAAGGGGAPAGGGAGGGP